KSKCSTGTAHCGLPTWSSVTSRGPHGSSSGKLAAVSSGRPMFISNSNSSARRFSRRNVFTPAPVRTRTTPAAWPWRIRNAAAARVPRSEEHTSELQSLTNVVCRRLLGKKEIAAADGPYFEDQRVALGVGKEGAVG